MQQLKKSNRLQNVNYEIRGPVLEEADRMAAAGEKILKLNIGNPAPFGFKPDEQLMQIMREQLLTSQGYSESKGIRVAREAIAEYCAYKGIEGVTADDIFTGNGVSEMIIMTMQAFLNHGDEILVPAPDYPLWSSAVCLCGGTPVYYPCDEQADWAPDLDAMRRCITPRTRGIVIINPNNPTGAVYSKEILLGIVQIAREHNLVIFSDEIYDRLLMDGVEHTSIASLAPDLFTATYNGLSKSHLVTGFRCGWMCLCGNKSGIENFREGLNTLASLRLCSNVPAQSIVPFALSQRDKVDPLYQPGGRVYEQREFIVNALNSIPGVSAVKPQATFYIFPRLDTKKFGITDDKKFAVDLLRQKKILIVPGTGFHWDTPDHFRIVYLPKMQELETGMQELADFLSSYRQG